MRHGAAQVGVERKAIPVCPWQIGMSYSPRLAALFRESTSDTNGKAAESRRERGEAVDGS
jgi:hypothetical protein